MTRSAPDVRIAGMTIVFAAFYGCSGKVIHLGDGKGQGGSGASDDAMDGPRGAGGSGGAGADCPHGQVKASEVLWIGDAWVTTPGNQHTLVRDYARAKGAIGPDEDYVIAAYAGGRMAEQSMAKVAEQYTNSIENAGATKFKVLIMDGGTLDPWLFGNTPATIDNAVNIFKQLLAAVAGDGTVEHVIYFLCPEHPMIPGNAELRPVMRQTCEESPVACHFLDLQPFWAGHSEYFIGVLPTRAGGQIIAEQIWRIMQDNCIAQ